MAITSGFFRSDGNDRIYNAAFFARYFGTLIGNGVFPRPANALRVVPGGNFNLSVNPGVAWINGYIMFNDSAYTLTLDPADGSQNRIDLVVIRFDAQSRDITLAIKRGALSTNPSPPTLTRNNDIYELGLADIRINAGQTSITTGNITDQRLNTALCGIVTGLIQQADTTDVFNQYQQGAQDAIAADQARFDQFLADLEAALDGNVAASLNQRLTQVETQQGNTNTSVNNLLASRGQPNGLATLDSSGRILSSQVPSQRLVIEEFSTPGTFTWTVPAGVTEAYLTAVAGGGGGSSSNTTAGYGQNGGFTSFGSRFTLTGGSAGTNGPGNGAGMGGVNGTFAITSISSGGIGGRSVLSPPTLGTIGGSAAVEAGFGAGGGGGTFSAAFGHGGGGGAGILNRRYTFTPGETVQITIGAGGAKSNNGNASKGGDGYLRIEYIL